MNSETAFALNVIATARKCHQGLVEYNGKPFPAYVGGGIEETIVNGAPAEERWRQLVAAAHLVRQVAGSALIVWMHESGHVHLGAYNPDHAALVIENFQTSLGHRAVGGDISDELLALLGSILRIAHPGVEPAFAERLAQRWFAENAQANKDLPVVAVAETAFLVAELVGLAAACGKCDPVAVFDALECSLLECEVAL